MLSNWKGPSTIGEGGPGSGRPRVLPAFMRRMYGRSGFSALPPVRAYHWPGMNVLPLLMRTSDSPE